VNLHPSHLKRYLYNALLAGMVKIFGEEIVRTTVERYAITFDGNWINFPQVDKVDTDRAYRTGKTIFYLSDGHRCKKTIPRWDHIGITENYRQCLTGLHVVKAFPEKQIAIVEGQSTMLFMACLSLAAELYITKPLQVFSRFIWLCTGGVGGVDLSSRNIIDPLQGRKVTLYPDTGAYEQWAKHCSEMKRKGIEVGVSLILEKAFKNDKVIRNTDLRDYFMSMQNEIVTLLKNSNRMEVLKDGSLIEIVPEGYPAMWDK
jgi:hypothetical protein